MTLQAQQKAILLRSRLKPGESSSGQCHSLDCPEKISQSLTNNKSSSDKNSTRLEFGGSMSEKLANRANNSLKCFIGVFLWIVFLLVLIGAYMLFIFEHERQGTMGSGHSVIVTGQPQIPTWRVLNDSMEHAKEASTTRETWTQSSILATAIPPHPQSRKFPLVDRAMLDRLDRTHRSSLPDDPSTTPARWPPRIIRIPERLRSGSLKTAESPCESPTHRRACRFLFPLRIAEKESKARVHFLQLLQLAKSLNRTLVLPNVGKSKIGACFKWEFNAYYDESGLRTSLSNEEWFIKQDMFRDWVNDRGRNTPLKAQLVSISSGLPSMHKKILQLEPTYINQDVDIHAYKTYGAWQSDLPGCFSTKFQRLDVGSPPGAFMSVKTGRRDINSGPLRDSVIDTLSAIVSKSLQKSPDDEPPVIIVNWDLRHPIFITPFPNQMLTLPYSAAIVNFAERLAPISPYLAVHWEMKTIDPQLLHECAHALVDVLSLIVHEEHHNPETVALTSRSITRTIWFSSDYPYPIARRTSSQARPAIVAKSGTFKDFEARHEEAVDILRDAFDDEHSELRKWKLTDFVEGIELGRFNKGSDEEDLLQDSGVSGILDKLISIKAAIFISGSSKCGRKSTFTKQVVDARESAWVRTKSTHLRNIINTFG